jgi:hypothetical protein
MKIISHKKARLLVLVLVVASLAVVVLNLYERQRLRGFRNQLRASGEKLTIDELTPRLPAAGPNSAAAFLELTNLLQQDVLLALLDTNPPTVMRLVAPGKAVVGWKRPDIRNGQAVTTWEQAQAAIDQSGRALTVLHSLIDQPTLVFDLDYRQGPTLLLPHLVPMKLSAELLSAATLCRQHRGDTAMAVTNLRSLLALIKGTKDERLVISQLVRIANAYLAFNANWELLHAPGLTEDQLAALQRDWTELEFIPAAENALLMERAMIETTLARLRQSRRPIGDMAGAPAAPAGTNTPSGSWLNSVTEFSKGAWQDTQLLTRETLWRYSWSYSDELRALKGGRALLDTIRFAQTNGYFISALRRQETQLKKLGFDKLPRDPSSPVGSDLAAADIRWFFSRSVRSIEDYPQRIMTVETARLMVATANALKRYQLRHGNYPGNLSALVPELLPAVPCDPVDGKPLRYQLAGNTFLLYSVGSDGVDNGGDPGTGSASGPFSWSGGRDYVWPQPATEREILADEQKLTIRRD